jgi:hypothetical protein
MRVGESDQRYASASYIHSHLQALPHYSRYRCPHSLVQRAGVSSRAGGRPRDGPKTGSIGSSIGSTTRHSTGTHAGPTRASQQERDKRTGARLHA